MARLPTTTLAAVTLAAAIMVLGYRLLANGQPNSAGLPAADLGLAAAAAERGKVKVDLHIMSICPGSQGRCGPGPRRQAAHAGRRSAALGDVGTAQTRPCASTSLAT